MFRLYRISVRGVARFTRRSRRSPAREIAFVREEYPNAGRVELEILEPARERCIPGLDPFFEIFPPAEIR